MPSDWPELNSLEQPIELELSQLSDAQILSMEALDTEETGKTMRGNYQGRIPNWEKFAQIVLKNPNIKISNPKAFDDEVSARIGEIALAILGVEALREAGPEIAEFEEMLVSFELAHPLAELHSIVELTPQEAPSHPIREPARLALDPIVAKLNILKIETNINKARYEELKAKYKRLSNAVGFINNGKVDHNR